MRTVLGFLAISVFALACNQVTRSKIDPKNPPERQESRKVEDLRIKMAKELFETYVRMEHAFDPSLAELYSDDAVIRIRRIYPTGKDREITISAASYTKMIRAAMPLAEARGDRNTYSNVTFTIEGEGVRIEANRYSQLKKYHSPLSILAKPSASGVWLIYEVIGESQV